MSELGPIDRDRYELIRRLVEAAYDGLVRQVIADVRTLPDSFRQSGDDSKLKDVWEEFKYQIQREQSFAFDAYSQLILDLCERRVESILEEQQQLLWLWSDGYLDLWADEGEVSLDDLQPTAVAKELYDRVCNAAGSEELAVDPDEERDR